jgi:hypothetical protein
MGKRKSRSGFRSNRKIKLLSLATVFLGGLIICGLSFWPPVFALAADVTLAWNPNNEPILGGYLIYYGAYSGGPYDGEAALDGPSPINVPLGSLTDPRTPRLTIRGLADGTYYFTATAYDSQGYESTFSNEVAAHIVDGRVTVVTISDSSGSGGGGGCFISATQ